MENPCKIIFFGDSITREYAPKFGEELKREYSDNDIEIINAGVISETSRDGLKRADGLVYEKPQVVVVGFGMNDWRKGVGAREFKENMSKIVDKFMKIDARVILNTISPAYKGFSEGPSIEVDEYNNIIRSLAREKKIKIADINSLWQRKLKPIQKGLRDEIHPNNHGYKIILEALKHVVTQSHTVVLWQYNGRECKCNYKCPYCYYAYSSKTENYFWGDIEDWHKAFLDCFGNQRLIFYLAFGEPTLGEAFYEVVKMIESEPKWSLRITSNLSQDLTRLMETKLVKDGRLNINASFHPTQTTIDEFLKQLLLLREHGIEAPIVYVMWPGHFKRFEKDFKIFNKHNFVVHIRRFKGVYKKKQYPDAYTDSERRFVAKYCDDATIKYMLNEKPVFDRRTYSGFHFFIVDCTGNIGLDSDCFHFQTKYRTLLGNIIQSHMLALPQEPPEYPMCCVEGTVDGVSNYIETGYHQLEGNNVLHFAKQGGVYKTKSGVRYKHLKTDFTNSKIRAEYFFPPRNLKDKFYLIKHMGAKNYFKSKKYKLYRIYQFGTEKIEPMVKI